MELHGVNEIIYTILSGLTLILIGVIAYFLKKLIERIDETSSKLTDLIAEHLRLKDRVDVNYVEVDLKTEHAREMMTERMKNYEKSIELLKESIDNSFTMISQQIKDIEHNCKNSCKI